jgi:hypothetical protein
MSFHQVLEKCNAKPKIQYLTIDDSEEYLISDKCFFPKNPDEFNTFITDFTSNPDKYLYYPENTSYMFEDNNILFKNDKDEIEKFNYIPICSVSGKLREINGKKISSLLWSWNNKTLGVSPTPELKKKVEDLKSLTDQDFKLRQFGLAFREHEFENPIDTAIYQATVYTSWFCKKLNGFKIFFNMSSGGDLIELSDKEKENYGLENIVRPYTFLVLFN